MKIVSQITRRILRIQRLLTLSAALSFARAARDNPDDDRVLASFASAAGLQHPSPACVVARRCVSGNIAAWAKRFGKFHERAAKKSFRRQRRDENTGAVLPMRKLLGAISIFAAKVEPDKKALAPLAEMSKDVLARLKRNDE